MKYVYLVAFILVFSSQSFAQKYEGPQDEIETILLKIKQFSSFYMAGDYESMANAYTVEGKILPPGATIIEGRPAIKQYWTLPQGVSVPLHEVTPTELKVTGNYAHDVGYYRGQTKRADGSISSWKGKYVIVWQKVDNEWKIHLDAWSRVDD